MKNINKILVASFLFTAGLVNAQTGIGTTTPDASAVLDVTSSTKGFLLPRHTNITRDAIALPAKGLMIFNTTANELQTNTGTSTAPIWTASGVGPTGPQGPAGADGTGGVTTAGTNITITGAGTTASPYVVNSVIETATQTPNTAIVGSATQVAVPSTNVQGAISDLATAVKTAEINLYNSNGTLSGARTVTQGTNTLAFAGTGSVGLGFTFPQAKLEIGLDGSTTSMDRLAIYSVADNTAGIQTLLDNQPLAGYNYAGFANSLVLQPRAGSVGIGVTPSTNFHTIGGVRFQGLAGTGSRMVVADATGVLSAQAIPSSVTGSAPISVASGVVSLNDTGVTTAKLADNAVTIAKLPAGATASTFLRGDGTWATPAPAALAITNPSTDNYTVLVTDAVIYRSLTAAGTITFPASLPAGKVFYIANTSGSSDWTLSPAPINAGTVLVGAGQSLTVITLGSGNIMVATGY
jgi:hypothetical protein